MAKRAKTYKNGTGSQCDLFIDLFAGCGGLSLGLLLSGWRGLFAVEKDPLAFETLRYNLIEGSHGLGYEWPTSIPIAPYSIASFIKSHYNELARLHKKVALIAGGPPCQSFSFAGKRKCNDPKRYKLFQDYCEVVSLIQPQFLLLENVRGITVEFGKEKRALEKKTHIGRPPKPFADRLRDKLDAIGYKVYAGLVNAVDFGVPQFRTRYILFGIHKSLIPRRSEIDPFTNWESIRKDLLRERGLQTERPISVREAISDLESSGKSLIECVDSPGFKQIVYEGPKTYYQKLLHGSMNGNQPNSLRLVNHREDTQARFSMILQTCRRGVQLSLEDRERLGIRKICVVPLDPEKPSHTLTTLPDDLLHYSEPRILTVREYARLQSFPDWYEFKGKYTTGGPKRTIECPRYTQVGNAVPPMLGEMLGRVLQGLKRQITLR